MKRAWMILAYMWKQNANVETKHNHLWQTELNIWWNIFLLHKHHNTHYSWQKLGPCIPVFAEIALLGQSLPCQTLLVPYCSLLLKEKMTPWTYGWQYWKVMKIVPFFTYSYRLEESWCVQTHHLFQTDETRFSQGVWFHIVISLNTKVGRCHWWFELKLTHSSLVNIEDFLFATRPGKKASLWLYSLTAMTKISSTWSQP